MSASAEERARIRADYAALAADPDNAAEANEVIAFIDSLPPVSDDTKSNRGVKPAMVKVRNNIGQPIAIDGTVLDPRVLAKDGKVVKEAPVVDLHEKHLKRLGNMVTRVAAFAALLFLGFTASAQQYKAPFAGTTSTNIGTALFTNQFVLNGIPTNNLSVNGTNNTFNSLAAGGTNTYNLIFPITKYGDFSAFMSSAAVAASISNSVWQWDIVPDATNWFNLSTITLAQTGTTPVTYATNWPETTIGNFGYVRLRTFASPTSIVAQTNITVIIPVKPSRHGT